MHPMDPKSAESLALSALIWIASDPEKIGAFLGASGASAEDLRARASDPDFLGFLLDFLLMDDASVTEFAASIPCVPADVMRARAGLPGGDLPSWT